MIIYGTGSRTVSELPVPELPCQACGEAQLEMSGVLRHFHLFWIPIFPFSRVVLTRCRSCNQMLDAAQVPAPLLARMRGELFTGWRMARSFVGVIVIAVIAVWAIGHGKELDRRTDAYLAQPEVGDVYLVESRPPGGADKQYGLMEVYEVTPTLLRFRSGHLYGSKAAANKALDRREEEFASDYVYDVARSELQSQRRQGELLSIERPIR